MLVSRKARAGAAVLGLTVLACGLSVPAAADPAAELEAELNAIRAAAERFKDINVALAEGYIDPEGGVCFTAADLGLPAEVGAMGIYYVRPELLGISATEPRVDGTGTHTDFLNPAILIYEPQADGSLELVAVENLVFKKAWDAQHSERPVLLGRSWDHMEDDPSTEVDEAHGFEPHYDQHVWVFRDNPAGPLEPFNPAVTCEHHQASHQRH
jgi:hypothetical protein